MEVIVVVPNKVVVFVFPKENPELLELAPNGIALTGGLASVDFGVVAVSKLGLAIPRATGD